MIEPRPKRPAAILPLIVILLGLLMLIAAFLFWRQSNQVAAQTPVASPIVEVQPTSIPQSNPSPPSSVPVLPGTTPTPEQQSTNSAAIQLPRFDEPSFPDVARISLKDAKAAFDAKSAIFVDVRGKDSYDISHVTGAINIPLEDIPTRAKELDPHAWIITYCTWPNENSSAGAAHYLLAHGYQKVTPILGGFFAWQNAGYPTVP